MGHERRFQEFSDSTKSLLKTGKHSDSIITGGKDTHNVHKSIACSQSDVLDAASKFEKEKEEGRIDLVDDDPDAVQCMIRYLYELDYDIPTRLEYHIPCKRKKEPWAVQLHESIKLYKSPGDKRRYDSYFWKISTVWMHAMLDQFPGLRSVCPYQTAHSSFKLTHYSTADHPESQASKNVGA